MAVSFSLCTTFFLCSFAQVPVRSSLFRWFDFARSGPALSCRGASGLQSETTESLTGHHQQEVSSAWSSCPGKQASVRKFIFLHPWIIANIYELISGISIFPWKEFMDVRLLFSAWSLSTVIHSLNFLSPKQFAISVERQVQQPVLRLMLNFFYWSLALFLLPWNELSNHELLIRALNCGNCLVYISRLAKPLLVAVLSPVPRILGPFFS